MTRAGTNRRWAVLVLLSAALLLAYMSLARDVPFLDLADDGKRVTAVFAETAGVREGDPVRVRGVEVGAVEGVDLEASGSRATVTMGIDEQVHIRRDARAALRWRTLLGGSFYVDLDPGSPSSEAAPVAEPIPLSRTSYQVRYDDLLEPFDGTTRRSTRNLLRQLSRGLADAEIAGNAIDALSPALGTVARGVRPLRGRESDDLRRLVASAGRAADALGANGVRLRRLIDGGARTLETFAANRTSVGDTLELSPAAFDDTRVTMGRLERTLDRLDPLVDQLRPGARSLAPSLRSAAPTLREANALLTEAKPLLRSLSPTVARLAGAAREGAPLIDDLLPTVDRLDSTLLPFLARRDPDTGLRNYEAIGPTAAVASSAGAEFDGGGYLLHFPAPGDERSLATLPCQTFFTDPTAGEKLRCEALQQLLGQILPPPPGAGR